MAPLFESAGEWTVSPKQVCMPLHQQQQQKSEEQIMHSRLRFETGKDNFHGFFFQGVVEGGGEGSPKLVRTCQAHVI